MRNETQVKQKGGTGVGQIKTVHRYRNYNTTKKHGLKSNTAKLKDAVLTQSRPSDTNKYEDPIKIIISYFRRE